MNSTTPAIQMLARRLIALEATRDARPVAGGNEAARVCEKLRVPLAKFAGVAGYRSLISRAMAMSKAEAPLLEPVQVRLDGSLEGFDGIAHQDAEAGVVVLVHLLSLLVTFIGKSLTLGLVRDAWPDAPLDETDSGPGEQS
jgi:hypothetical protein